MKRITKRTRIPNTPLIGFRVKGFPKGYIHILNYRSFAWKGYVGPSKHPGISTGNCHGEGKDFETLSRWVKDTEHGFRAYLFKTPRALFAWLAKP